jgi:hypothetical protein
MLGEETAAAIGAERQRIKELLPTAGSQQTPPVHTHSTPAL